MTGAEVEVPDTRQALITAAIDAIEMVGFTGFSYRDLSATVGITTASIHYHFPLKADLGVAVIAQLERDGRAMYAAGEAAHGDIRERFRARINDMREYSRNPERMCAFGSLLSDYGSLPEAMQRELVRCEAWLQSTHTRWLDEGRRAGQLYFPGEPAAMAGLIGCVFQGLTMHHRAQRDLDVDAVLDQLLRLIGA